MPAASCKKVDLLEYFTKKQGHGKELSSSLNGDTVRSGRKPPAALSSPSDELSIAQELQEGGCGNEDVASRNIQHSSSFNMLTKKTLQKTLPAGNFPSSSLKETCRSTRHNSIAPGVSGSSRARNSDRDIPRESRNTGERLVGHRIKLWSPIDKCYYFGTVNGFESANSTHKITYDSGEADVVSLDSEEWEISTDSTQTEINDKCESGHRQEKALKEKDKFQANTKKRNKVLSDTSVSEVININEKAFGRRTRQKA